MNKTTGDLLEPIEPEQEPEGANLEDAFQGLFKTSASGTGEEELLRIASTFSMQLTMQQVKTLLYIKWIASTTKDPVLKARYTDFVAEWLQFKQFNNSDLFVMKALDSISLRKFIGENAFKINIEK